MQPETSSAPSDRRSVPRSIAIAVVAIPVLLAVMVIAFALPASRSGPHELPIGVVGSEAQAQQLSSAANSFDVTRYPDAASARDAINHRGIYGAVIVDSNSVTSMVASAASPTVAGLIPALGNQIAQQVDVPARTQDVRAFPSDDPKGAGLSAGALPLALGGWIAAMVIMLLIPSPRARLAAVVGVAAVGGIVLVSTLRFVIGTFDTNFWFISLAAMVGIGATCMMVLGLRELLGGAGLGIAGVLLILLGNPLSGLASAPELLPRPWGSIGQFLPPGATGALLRDTAFFDGHDIARPLTILLCWLAGGAVLYGLGLWRNSRNHEVDDDEVHIGRHEMDQVPPATRRVVDSIATPDLAGPTTR